MPTYDYCCKSCGHELEIFQSITAEPLKKCPECGRLGLRRMIGSGAGIIFKGSGFYQTDYKGAKDKKDAPGKSSKKEEKPAKPTETKAEAKPAAKSEP